MNLTKNIYRKLSGKGLSRWFPHNFFARKVARNLTGNVIAKVLDFEMIVPIENDYGIVLYSKGIYEATVTKYIKQFLCEGNTFVDVGACFGYYSLLASNIVGSKGRVLAFEPNQFNFSFAADNIYWNDFTNIKILNAAASNKVGKANLNISQKHIGCHSLHQTEYLGHKDQVEIVDTIPIENCIDKVDVIKIDVEGWEYYVLKGMESFFNRGDGMIIFQEYCPQLLKETPEMWDLLIKFIQHHAIGIAIINEKKKQLDFINVEKIGGLKKRVNLVWWS